jgi:hypothetical protein
MHSALKLGIGIFTLLTIISCSDDEITQVTTAPVEARFTQTELTVDENAGPLEIAISLAKPAIREGIIIVNIEGNELEKFTTSPAAEGGQIELSVMAGQSVVKFILTPVNDENESPDQTIEFTIQSASDGFVIGSEKVLKVSLNDDEVPSQVGFMLNQGSARENASIASDVIIVFSHAMKGTGTIEISMTSGDAIYGTHFVTVPEAVNGKITLPVEDGEDHVQFKVIPLNDLHYNGNRNINYVISNVEGSMIKGDQLTHQLTITDDELEGKYKGYTVVAGNWSYKRIYEYNEDGTVSKINWEQNTPYYSGGTYVFHYNEAGQVIKRVESAVDETNFTWQDGRIVKAEKFNNGVLKQYTLYGYDNAGNVGEAAVHDRQPDGELKLSLLFVYLYRTDGNIYKQLTHVPIEGPEEYSLISTRTFDQYLATASTFSMMEILPNVNSQPNLPGSYQVEENGHNILYQFSYEFDENGKPTRRTASSSAGSEVAYYEYY